MPWVQRLVIIIFAANFGNHLNVVKQHLEEAHAAGLLGKNILGSGVDFELYNHLVQVLIFVVKKQH